MRLLTQRRNIKNYPGKYVMVRICFANRYKTGTQIKRGMVDLPRGEIGFLFEGTHLCRTGLTNLSTRFAGV